MNFRKSNNPSCRFVSSSRSDSLIVATIESSDAALFTFESFEVRNLVEIDTRYRKIF